MVISLTIAMVIIALTMVIIIRTNAKHIEMLTMEIQAVDEKVNYPEVEIGIISESEKKNSDEIELIIARLDQIVADIAELNKENISDHRDLVDIRTRYINYRQPINPNSGVQWADEYKSEEDK